LIEVENAMSKERPKTPGGLSGKLLAVEPEYRFAVYKKLIAKRRGKVSGKGSPMLPGSYESGKRR
jgi:hypothetical protein